MAAHLKSNLGDGSLRGLAFPCEEELHNIKRHFPDCVGIWAERANTTNITSGWALSSAECTPSCQSVFASVAALSSEQCLTSTHMPAGIRRSRSRLTRTACLHCPTSLTLPLHLMRRP